MKKFTSPEIKLISEKQVELWLTSNGYTDVVKEILQSHESVLIANGKVENIMVQISTFKHILHSFRLTKYEIDKLTKRAAKLKLVAYAAYVILDNDNHLVGEIVWERL